MTEAAHLTATRAGYDAIAEQYAEEFRAALEEAPLDRALLTGFAEMVRRDHPDPQLLEVGSGPGNVAAHLHQLGMPVAGSTCRLPWSTSRAAYTRKSASRWAR